MTKSQPLVLANIPPKQYIKRYNGKKNEQKLNFEKLLG